MNHKQKLLEIHQKSLTGKLNLTSDLIKDLDFVDSIIESQKALFTILITLAVHKILNPKQDIRNHKKEIKDGFSGRTIDTEHITPTLRELGYISMAESGWLTRSFEQPHPFDKNFPGKIKKGKKEFLSIVDMIQNNPSCSEDIIKSIFRSLNRVKEKPNNTFSLKNAEKLSNKIILNALENLLSKNFKSSMGSKLPVLMVYSCLKVMLDETLKYKGCELKELGSHLSSDLRSGASGDIEIFKNDNLFESYEIKLDVEISLNVINRVKDKIYKHNPRKYLILSSKIKESDKSKIDSTIDAIKIEHGCEIIILSPIDYIESCLIHMNFINKFILLFNKLVLNDKELKLEHKKAWQEIYNKFNKI